MGRGTVVAGEDDGEGERVAEGLLPNSEGVAAPPTCMAVPPKPKLEGEDVLWLDDQSLAALIEWRGEAVPFAATPGGGGG